MSIINLSEEQQVFVTNALEGNNILVNACIGSGKTTAIQLLCNKLPVNKNILYLTYNKLLKIDAQTKITRKNVKVQNYDGLAAYYLWKKRIYAGLGDHIPRFLEVKPPIDKYDVLIIDEYQDIETYHSELLEYIKAFNPNIQIIAVGDMQQKIYDKTNLNVSEFIQSFLGKHIELEFTLCFRLSANLADKLGRIWHKRITGVNNKCIVEEMSIEQIVAFLSTQNPKDILCLGERNGTLSKILNILESEYPSAFNKETVYASISDHDSISATQPNENTAIFTTFDSSKGLERNICIIFDFTESYWETRISKPLQSYEILRNIFCVAASRGKSRIIFVNTDEAMLSEATLSTRVDNNHNLCCVDISAMFDFKFKEDIEKCFSLIDCKPILSDDCTIIEVKNKDGMIDLSPCIGIFQEAMYFDSYEIDKAIEMFFLLNQNKKYLWNEQVKNSCLEQKTLFLVSLETNQDRYRKQVELPFVNDEAKNQIIDRLSTRLNHNEKAQVKCAISFSDKKDGDYLFFAGGYADVVKDNIVYELKFVSNLTHEHFLQCACYIVALKLEKGILWNTRDNTAFEITIPNKKAFLDAVTNAITKNKITSYYKPNPQTILRNTEPLKIAKSSNQVVNGDEIHKYQIGATIRHSLFGEGTITKTKVIDANLHILDIKFKLCGIKTIPLETALNAGAIKLISSTKPTSMSKEDEINIKYKTGYEEVKDLFTQQTHIIRDKYKNRWVKCETCGTIKQDAEFATYGGDNHVNLGICKDCNRYKKA